MILRRAAIAAMFIAAIAVSWACDAGEERAATPPTVQLDGSPRFPDDQGVATAMTSDEITLDGARTYQVSAQLQSFSTSTLELEPFRKRLGQYVLIGTDGDEVVWIAAVASVIRGDGPPRVYYTGTLIEHRNPDLIFKDGTVLRAAADLELPDTPARITVQIDAARREVTAVE